MNARLVIDTTRRPCVLGREQHPAESDTTRNVDLWLLLTVPELAMILAVDELFMLPAFVPGRLRLMKAARELNAIALYESRGAAFESRAARRRLAREAA